MIENLPTYIATVFGLTTLATLFQFTVVLFKSKDEEVNSKATYIIVCLTIWLLVQMIVSFKNFYSIDTLSFPPRFLILVLPPFLTILFVFLTNSGRRFVDSLPLLHLTYLHIVRIPVELVLFWLFVNKKIPELMTFAGKNYDMFSGLSAPIVGYFGIHKKMFGKKILIAWNLICLGLLLNVLIHGILSAPFSFQMFAFDQPNIAVLYYPFTWLPGFIVPVVMLCQLASIRLLLKKS